MKVNVEMLAFNDPGLFREVEISDEKNKISVVLEEIYFNGQNEVKPIKDRPSVSPGDVIHYNNKKFLVCAVGFAELTDKEYEKYCELPREKRMMKTFTKCKK